MSPIEPIPFDGIPIPDFDHYETTHLPLEIVTKNNVVSVTWDDHHTSHFPFIWLRDFSPDNHTLNPVTREPKLAITDLPEDLSVSTASIRADGFIEIVWQPENRVSQYHPGWLRAHCPGRPLQSYTLPAQELWSARDFQTPPAFNATKVKQRDGFAAWLTSLQVHGLGLIEGLEIDRDKLENMVSKIGPIRPSNFGSIFDVENRVNSNSNAYTSQALQPHTDLATREYQPGYQFLYCMENSATGGDSVFTDGYSIANKMKTEFPEEYACLSRQPIPFANRDQDSEYRYNSPVFESDRHGQLTTVRFTYWLRAPLTGTPEKIEQIYRSLRLFHTQVDDSKFQLSFRLKPGDLVGFDNRRILHGRTAFDPGSGNRWLRGCYLEREEVESRLRILSRQARAAFS